MLTHCQVNSYPLFCFICFQSLQVDRDGNRRFLHDSFLLWSDRQWEDAHPDGPALSGQYRPAWADCHTSSRRKYWLTNRAASKTRLVGRCRGNLVVGSARCTWNMIHRLSLAFLVDFFGKVQIRPSCCQCINCCKAGGRSTLASKLLQRLC